ncbi:spondin domain-containing protein [Shewanella gelidimarina]|uniref:spondin domain-containing protein n=1 Tax=Shewanella gelidimarina TaxID=56813 RepID=UPI00200DD8CE|nr:spondin domain-containing protein [Shewanella gelidimarina]MCL1056629.1 spondin domain-containing protein [Shewanella gelidimarina]
MNYPKLNFKYSATAIIAFAAISLAGCSDNDNDSPAPVQPPVVAPVMQDYSVMITNLTANQPMSPVAVVAQESGSRLWSTGMAASVALETLAESGDSSGLTGETGVNELFSGDGVLVPGATQSITMSLEQSSVADLSIVTMLVNTNDAFAGTTGFNLSTLAVDDATTLRVIAYDAGTEANSEEKGTIPGPADGGEGFNAVRDDNDKVHGHPGVISADDGLADSVLSASHRFDNPVMIIKITRTK